MTTANPSPPPSPFIDGTTLQFAWDSTSLTSFLSCPQQYKLRHIEGWRPKNPNVAVALAFGILVHSGIEFYHRAKATGANHDEAIALALSKIMLMPEYDKLPSEEEIEELKEAADDEDDGITLRNSKVRTRYHLWRALVWYFEQYHDEQLTVVHLANGQPAVEFSFRIPTSVTIGPDTPLLYCGHFDRIVEFNNEHLIVDTKTTKSITRQWQSAFDLSHQLTGYVLGGRIGSAKPVTGAVIDGIALQVGGVKFARSFTHRSESQLAEFIGLLGWVADRAELAFETSYYPLNTSACMFCEFKEHCRQPPELRAGYLNYYFERSEPWNPLRSR